MHACVPFRHFHLPNPCFPFRHFHPPNPSQAQQAVHACVRYLSQATHACMRKMSENACVRSMAQTPDCCVNCACVRSLFAPGNARTHAIYACVRLMQSYMNFLHPPKPSQICKLCMRAFVNLLTERSHACKRCMRAFDLVAHDFPPSRKPQTALSAVHVCI
jgi:hypothetical protein